MARSSAAKPSLVPLTGRRRAADAIVEDLRGRIASGALPHGARLPAERDLAASYGVSGPTIREALQGLNAMGLLDVRHGSGTYVSALADALVAKSLGTLVQLEGVSVQNLVGLLGALNGYAARLAIDRATAEDIAALESAIDALAEPKDIDSIARSLKDFIARLAAAAHDPLLLAIAKFLIDVQLELALTDSRSFKQWSAIVGLLQPDRIAIVEALKRRNGEEFLARVSAFNARAASLIDTQASTRIPASDARLVRILAHLAAPERRFAIDDEDAAVQLSP